MSESISATIKNSGLTLDSVFVEVQHSEGLNLPKANHIRFFHTANLLPSTLSVTTSFLAVYLTFRRSAYFPLAYAANDLVLIVLWTLAAMEDPSYLSVVICFVMFLVNDGYGFLSWSRMQKRQQQRRKELA